MPGEPDKIANDKGKKSGGGTCLLVISLLVVALGVALAPILTAKSVFKDKVIFQDC